MCFFGSYFIVMKWFISGSAIRYFWVWLLWNEGRNLKIQEGDSTMIAIIAKYRPISANNGIWYLRRREL